MIDVDFYHIAELVCVLEAFNCNAVWWLDPEWHSDRNSSQPHPLPLALPFPLHINNSMRH